MTPNPERERLISELRTLEPKLSAAEGEKASHLRGIPSHLRGPRRDEFQRRQQAEIERLGRVIAGINAEIDEKRAAVNALPIEAPTPVAKAPPVLADLQRRMADAEQRLPGLQARRQKLALGAVTGDADDRAELDEVKGEIAQTESEIEDTRHALVGAQAQIAEAKRESAERAADEQFQQAQSIGAEILAEAVRIDQAAAALIAGLRRRNELRSKLARTNCLRSEYLNRLGTKGPINRMLVYHGLADHADFGNVGHSNIKPLVDGDRSVIGMIRRPVVTSNEDAA